jgi:purine-binding chemotaxis protein CheW
VSEGPIRSVLLPVGDDLYAVPARLVREVLATARPTRLPTAPPTVLGMINLRGDVLPMFDTAALLGLGRGAVSSFAVVVQIDGGAAALAVDHLPRMADLADRVGTSELRGTDGRFAVAGGVAVLLAVERLIA